MPVRAGGRAATTATRGGRPMAVSVRRGAAAAWARSMRSITRSAARSQPSSSASRRRPKASDRSRSVGLATSRPMAAATASGCRGSQASSGSTSSAMLEVSEPTTGVPQA